MTDENDADRQRMMMNLAPADWDARPMVLASEIRKFLLAIADEGTGIDSGGGDGRADLWVKIGGKEYFIQIAKSRKQQIADGDIPPGAAAQQGSRRDLTRTDRL